MKVKVKYTDSKGEERDIITNGIDDANRVVSALKRKGCKQVDTFILDDRYIGVRKYSEGSNFNRPDQFKDILVRGPMAAPQGAQE